MFHRFFGFLDLICILPLLISLETFSLFCGMYLVLKGSVFLIHKDVISFLDVVIGGYILLGFIGVYSFIFSVIAGLFLLQKGIFSLIR